jgi:Fic family protein
MPYDPLVPYDDLPPVPSWERLETRTVLRRCSQAHRALATLDTLCGHLPDPALIIHTLPLQEAMDSSEIENIATTQEDLIVAEVSPSHASPQAKEVLRYGTALGIGSDMAEAGDIDERLILAVGETVNGGSGMLRDREPVVIRKGRNVVYTPPRWRDTILRKLGDLTEFLRNTELDPLVTMSAAHYQFEAIHPFTDGNGRTGRLLNVLYLKKAGLLNLPVLYMSRFILENRAEYYHRLRAVTENGGWEGWLVFMLDGVRDTSLRTCEVIRNVRRLIESTAARCRKELPSRSYSRELVEVIHRKTYTQIETLVEAGIGNRHTVSERLRELATAGILEYRKIGRDAVYVNRRLIEVLTGAPRSV